MSVFHKADRIKPTGHEKEIPCNQYHRINGVIPTVNGAIHSIQHPELIHKTCDCRKCIYHESMCSCPSEKHWEVNWQPNPNY